MAFAGILRKSVPLATRLVGFSHRRYHKAPLISALKHDVNVSRKSPSSSHSYSTACDIKKPSSNASLLGVIESEIKLSQETDDHDRVEEIPEGFPFKIDDNAGHQTIILTREYDGENVKVEVHMPDLVSGGLDNDDDDETETPRSVIQLVVTVTKQSGTSLVFGCVAYPDEIEIDSLSVSKVEAESESEPAVDVFVYEGPNFHDLDENLKKSFHKYLEIRGIKPSTTNFLHEYMINKDSREYLGWLKNLKNFIEA